MDFNNHLDFMQKVMDVSALKRKTNADNIANYNTANFKASKVSFDHLFSLQKDISMKTTNDKHIAKTFKDTDSVKIEKDTTSRERFDGNNVDLNAEMIEMIKNNHVFSIGVQAVNKELTINRLAIGK